MSEPTQDKGGNSPINLSQIVNRDHRYELSINNETPEDAAARRSRELADADMKRKMAFTLFCFALLLVGIVFIGCVYTFATGTSEDKKWAAGIVSAIVSGLVGFLVGQGKK